MATRITKGKFDGITAPADERGVISAVAVDQREWLIKAIRQARGGTRRPQRTTLSSSRLLLRKC